LTPGAAIDAGHVDITSNLSPVSATPLDYSNLGVGGNVTMANQGGGRADAFIYNGTAANDTFGVTAAGVVTLTNGATGLAQLPVNTPGVIRLVLNGLEGDDTFNVAAGIPFTSTTINGGDPSASDVLNLTGDGTAIAVTLGGATQTVTGGGLGTVNISGVEIV